MAAEHGHGGGAPTTAQTPFSNPRLLDGYAQRTQRIVPALDALHRMAALLMAERAPKHARVLALGAGGGLELKAFAEACPAWTIDAVDPSEQMLDLARIALGPREARVRFHHGTVDLAPEGPFDAASCLLTMHHIRGTEERLRTLVQVRERLKKGAPFVMAHMSFPTGAGEKETWLRRYAAFAASSGLEVDIARFQEAMGRHLTVLAPEREDELLREAGFGRVELFYAAFAFRGWVAYA